MHVGVSIGKGLWGNKRYYEWDGCVHMKIYLFQSKSISVCYYTPSRSTLAIKFSKFYMVSSGFADSTWAYYLFFISGIETENKTTLLMMVQASIIMLINKLFITY